MKTLSLEFYKIRRRYIWWVIAALLAVQVLWALWAYQRMDARELQQGWRFCLYQLPLLNSIMMPLIVAILASRTCDIEHKGQAFRLLATIIPAGRLFDAKFLCGSIHLAALSLLQILFIVAAGSISGFSSEIPWEMFGWYLFFTNSLNMTIFALQQSLSLLYSNQMIALSVGLLGSFAGLFSMFFPPIVARLILWGYYGVLMFVRMDWHPDIRIANYFWSPINWNGYVALIVFFLSIYSIGRSVFVRKEI